MNRRATVILYGLNCNDRYHIIAKALLMDGNQEGPALFDNDTIDTPECKPRIVDDDDDDGDYYYHT